MYLVTYQPRLFVILRLTGLLRTNSPTGKIKNSVYFTECLKAARVPMVSYPQSAAQRRSSAPPAPLQRPSRLGRTALYPQHQPTATWYRRRAVQTSLRTRRSQPPCLSACLPVCPAELQTLPTATGKIAERDTHLRPPPSAGSGAAVSVYGWSPCFTPDAADLNYFPSTKVLEWDGTRITNRRTVRLASVSFGSGQSG